MFTGSLVSINIAFEESGPVHTVSEIHAVPGQGLEGDRYFLQTGTFSKKTDAGREVTLIEIEAIEALEREKSIQIMPGEARRNLVTRGVPLNHLVGKEFKVGEVTLIGVRLCEPCGHLANMTQPAVREGLIHRGGLRADIITEGIIKVGDPVTEK